MAVVACRAWRHFILYYCTAKFSGSSCIYDRRPGNGRAGRGGWVHGHELMQFHRARHRTPPARMRPGRATNLLPLFSSATIPIINSNYNRLPTAAACSQIACIFPSSSHWALSSTFLYVYNNSNDVPSIFNTLQSCVVYGQNADADVQ